MKGKKTEPIYFDSLRNDKRLSTTHIDIKGEGKVPKSLIARAEAIKSEKEYNAVWCVFDRDDHKKIDQARKQAKDNGINIAFSNPCFELWYLLHFKDQTANIHRKDVERNLKKHVPKYSKSMDLYDEIKDRQIDAIDRANELRKHQKENDDEITSNPSTNVDELVTYLNNISNLNKQK